MINQRLKKSGPSLDQRRFLSENAEAIREANEEQRRLAAKRKAVGNPDRVFLTDTPTGVIICMRR